MPRLRADPPLGVFSTAQDRAPVPLKILVYGGGGNIGTRTGKFRIGRDQLLNEIETPHSKSQRFTVGY